MNKADVIASIAGKTGVEEALCERVIDALEHVSGDVLKARMKGVKLQESAAVGPVCTKADVEEDVCIAVLTAFEETFGEALSDKFRFFK